jgi:arginine decarboxylase
MAPAPEAAEPVEDFVPRYVFLTKGCGKHKEQLNAFELALRQAKIAKYNLVTVSSIFPPNCRIIPVEKGIKMLRPGQIIFTVMSRNATNEPNRLIGASIGLALPSDKGRHGYLSEHHSFGQVERVSGDYAEDMAAEMLASTLGIEFDGDAAYDYKKEIWRLDGRIVTTREVTQTAIGDKKGAWTSVVAAAVFIL